MLCDSSRTIFYFYNDANYFTGEVCERTGVNTTSPIFGNSMRVLYIMHQCLIKKIRHFQNYDSDSHFLKLEVLGTPQKSTPLYSYFARGLP
jgi:hypothetical protein